MADEKKMQQISREGCKENNRKDAGKGQEEAEKESYTSYAYKIMKLVHPDTSISSKAIMNSFVNDSLEHIMWDPSCLSHFKQFREIQIARFLLLPRQLAKHAMLKNTKVVTKYTSSR
ncbi:histone H2B-like [Stegostoma tigrinum]|uniref:histone H2B-like n=1 Tax=Stegostoma tigrinum TaxID=3053191 RepID=UPI00286FF393|nr:histone H2B-like [Stegostoma tigrinum]